MSGGKKIGLSYRQLGIKKESRRYGTLRLVQWSPETNEVFLLRELSRPASPLVKVHIPPSLRSEAKELRVLNLLYFGKEGEIRVGHATYMPLGKSNYVKYLEAEPAHRKRDVASSLLSYIKTHGKDIWLLPNQAARPFYRKLGFSESTKYEGWELAAGMPLATSEKRLRKFMIVPRRA